ncbi:MAG: glycosyltransferase family 2 protein [Pseudomonadota bacterium]
MDGSVGVLENGVDISLLRTAVIIPCYNEAAAIGAVVRDFRAALPHAEIYVYDNNSTDDTGAVARDAGAIVRLERRRGKGAVVRRMFADIDADIYVMIDGDDTYAAADAPAFIHRLVDEGLDMVNGARRLEALEEYRAGHKFGNRMLTGIVRWIFGDDYKDMLSGYRVFSRRFVKSFPAMSSGFEIETELTVHALELRMPSAEIETDYGERPEESASKLKTFSDGFRILWMILILVKQERPMLLFGSVGLACVAVSLALGYPIVMEFIATGLVPRFPTAILSVGVMLIGVLSSFCGLVLDSVTRGRGETKRLHYLGVPSVHAAYKAVLDDKTRASA